LKLPGLNCEVWLRGMQFFRGDAKSLSLQDGKQISEVAKLGPIVHSSLLREERLTRYQEPDSSNDSAPPLWKSWQGEYREAIVIVQLAKFTLSESGRFLDTPIAAIYHPINRKYWTKPPLHDTLATFRHLAMPIHHAMEMLHAPDRSRSPSASDRPAADCGRCRSSAQCQYGLGVGPFFPKSPVSSGHPYRGWHSSLSSHPDRRICQRTGTSVLHAPQTPVK